MAPVFVVEDGTGLPDATSYSTLAELDSEAGLLSEGDAWLALTADADKERFAILAARDLDEKLRQQWTGYVVGCEQGLDWPRTGVYLRGCWLASDEIPAEVKRAHAKLAITRAKYPDADLDPVGLTSTSGSAGGQIIEQSEEFAVFKTTTKFAEPVSASSQTAEGRGIWSLAGASVRSTLRGLLGSPNCRGRG